MSLMIRLAKLIAALCKRYPRSYGWREVLRYRRYEVCEVLFPRWWCPGCNRFALTIERRRQNTAYIDSELNYVTCCVECFAEVEAYWEERWEEYYAGCL